MAPTHSTTKKLTDFESLSFDVFGTLVDWELGIWQSLHPSFPALDRHPLLASFSQIEGSLQAAEPSLPYNQLLTKTFLHLAEKHGVGKSVDEANLVEKGKEFAASIRKWPAFPDTVEAMRALGKRYKLVVLSNVDRESFGMVLGGALKGVEFDAIYTAQDIGSYKPDVRNFHYLIGHVGKDLGVEKGKMLHVAQSLFHDHVPCKKTEVGLPSVWIARKDPDGESAIGGNGDGEAYPNGKPGWEWEFPTLGAFSAAVETAFEGQE